MICESYTPNGVVIVVDEPKDNPFNELNIMYK